MYREKGIAIVLRSKFFFRRSHFSGQVQHRLREVVVASCCCGRSAAAPFGSVAWAESTRNLLVVHSTAVVVMCVMLFSPMASPKRLLSVFCFVLSFVVEFVF